MSRKPRQSTDDTRATDVAVGRPVPRLTGEWAMEINWLREGKSGKLHATAILREDENGIAMEVHSEGSDSYTLLAEYRDERPGSPVLYYLYEVEPKVVGNDAGAPYKGAAVLRHLAPGQLRGNYWTSQRSTGHFGLTRNIERENPKVESESVDVVLITALDMEYIAAKAVFSAEGKDADGVRTWTPHEQPAPHEAGLFYQRGEALFRIAIARPTRMGSIRSSHLASVLVERLRPSWLTMCGVCAGNPKSVALGDVIVSELTYQHDEGKREVDGFTGDHRQTAIADNWLHAAQALHAEGLPSHGPASAADAEFWLLEQLYWKVDASKHPARSRYFAAGAWKPVIEKLIAEKVIRLKGASLVLTPAGRKRVETSLALDIDPPSRLPFAIVAGPIASGNAVIKDGVTWDSLKGMGVRSVAGLEMEAATIGEVSRLSPVEHWIVIKGVMDHADPNKEDRFKPFAAQASAEVLRKFLSDRFHPRTAQRPAASTTLPSGPQSTWRPGTVSGDFFDELLSALEREAKRYCGIARLALDKAREASDMADRAYEIAETVRTALGASLIMARADHRKHKEVNLAAGATPGASRLIAKIWNSGDDYLGEASGDTPDGLGVTRTFVFSSDETPSLRTSFAGQHEGGHYGPSGIYISHDHSRLAASWVNGHPSLGYREYLGTENPLDCDFYLGPMQAEPQGLTPRWYPHGQGVVVDAAERRVRCGRLREGKLVEIDKEFIF